MTKFITNAIVNFHVNVKPKFARINFVAAFEGTFKLNEVIGEMFFKLVSCTKSSAAKVTEKIFVKRLVQDLSGKVGMKY